MWCQSVWMGLFLAMASGSPEAAITSEQPGHRQSRLFTNPFGILGHKICETNVRGEDVTGVCFNEVECFIKGGAHSGYCSPSPLSGVCCAFVNKICDRTVNHKVSYFTNPSYPKADSAAQLKLDYEALELASDGNGNCLHDSLTIINNVDGPTGRICGNKKGYSQVVRTTPGGSLKLAVVAQSPQHRWRVSPVQDDVSCGETGAEGFIFRRNSDTKRSRSHHHKGLRKVSKIRKRIPRMTILDFYNNAMPISSRCGKSHPPETCRSPKSEDEVAEDTEELTKKRLFHELYNPSFSAKGVFCDSKFRNKEYLGPSFKIIDGTDAPIHAFPWLVSLNYNGEHFCGGSLINQNTVITAAHCMDFGAVPDFFSKLLVYFGEHDLSLANETEFTTTRRVLNIIIHPRYSATPGSPGDVALLQLDRPVEYNRAIKPICLPKLEAGGSFEQMLAVAAGWGVTEDQSSSDILRQVELNIIRNSTCVENMNAINVPILEDMICTFKGPLGSETICSGDSGGPLMVRIDGKFTLAGLASFSVTDCSAPFPAVFARISYFKRRRRPRSIDKQFPYRSRPYQPTSAFLAKESNVLLKIVDGTQSRLHAFPWAASLSFVGGFHGCGGSLIRNDMIITAAHCVETPGFAEFIRVTLGEHDLSRPDETSFTVTRRVKRVILHPSYTAFLIGLPGDIALIILEDPVPFNQGIKPVCLPTNSPVGTFDNRMGIAAGWGLTENETNPDVIRQVDLNIISLEQCTTEWRLLDGLELTPAMICTFNGPLGTGSTCRGDSGGPLMVLEGTKQVLVGVTSFGTQNCSDPVSSVYSRVTYFMDWISAALSVFS
eukprot:maker-scaffold470_size172058-snap-gene-0.30 protein:Tk09897 transcript:maker-scaffold470_size172058-snap-gene-0.30-mRNA-1 annotation:"transmembrane protease serine 9-like"